MRDPYFKKGDLVSLEAWDQTVPPAKRFGNPGIVVKARECKSQNGVMYVIRASDGREIELDEAWLNPYEGNADANTALRRGP